MSLTVMNVTDFNGSDITIATSHVDNVTVSECFQRYSLCSAERIGHSAIVPTIAVIGILLNGFTVYVLTSSRQFRQSSYMYLNGLAIADLLSLILFAVNGFGRGLYPANVRWRVFEVYCYFPFGASTTTSSVLLTVMVSLERFIFIYRPTYKTWCSSTVAVKMLSGIFTVSILINVPRFFVLKVSHDDGRLQYTGFGRSMFYRWLSWFYLFGLSIFTSLCLVVVNVLLVIGVRRLGQRRLHQFDDRQAVMQTYNVSMSISDGEQRLSAFYRRRRNELNLTRTVVAVIVVFVVGELPSAFTSRTMVVALLGNHMTQPVPDLLSTTGYRIAVLVSTTLVVTQHSVNFIVYCLFNHRFCDEVCRWLLAIRRVHRQREGEHVITNVDKPDGRHNVY